MVVRFRPIIVLLLSLSVLPCKTASAADWHSSTADQPVSAPQTPADSDETSTSRQDARHIVWIYFSNRGHTNPTRLQRAVADAGERVSPASRARRARQTGGRFVPDESDVPTPAGYVRGIETAGARVRHVSRWLNAASVEVNGAGLQKITTLPFVSRVSPVLRTQLEHAPPGDYGLTAIQNQGIHAIAAHDSGYSAAGIVVAVFDTGFRKDHLALAPLKRIAEWDFVQSDGETANQTGDDQFQWNHGTGVWSILGAYWPGQIVGPAYNASFVLAKTKDITDVSGVDEDHWVAAAQWADSIGIDILSTSMVAYDSYAALDGRTTAMAQAANILARHGVLVVCAMGNAGPALGTLWTPADCDSILSVGSVDEFNTISEFSGRGPTFDGRGKPDLVAQGYNTIWADPSTVENYGSYPGTSLATPLVSGAAALVQEAHPEWTAQQVRFALKATADKASTPDSTTFGWGRPNSVAAIYQSALGPPVYPKPFALVAPAFGSVITGTPLSFLWRRAVDLTPGDAVSYTIQLRRVTPSLIVFTDSTADTSIQYTGALDPATTYEWNVVAEDLMGHARSSTEPFLFTTGGGVDQAPLVTAPAGAGGPEGTPLSISVTAADPDGEAIATLTATPLPPGAAFSPNPSQTSGTFSWTPTFSQAGTYGVTFTASNALTGTATTTITVTNVNRAPTLAPIPALTVDEAGVRTQLLTAADPDSDTVTLSKLSGPPFASVNDTTLTISPGYADSGSYTVVVRATDGSLHEDQSASVTVTNVDRAPIVTAPAIEVANAGTSHSFSVGASDPDVDPITSIAVDTASLPAGSDVTFVTSPSNDAGVFTWNSTPSDTGTFLLSFTATNSLVGGATTLMELRRPLLITAPTDTVGVEGVPLTVTATATDPDASHVLTLSLTGAPAGFSLEHTPSGSPATAILTGTPTQVHAANSPHTLVWNAQDGDGGTASATTMLHISHITAVPIGEAVDEPPRVVRFGSRPNPFQSSTQIEFRVERLRGSVTLQIYDVRGRLVRTLLDRVPMATAAVLWDATTDSGERAGAGVYYCRLNVGATRLTRRFVLLR